MTITLGSLDTRTPKGNVARYSGRPDTNDGALIGGIVAEDEYGLVDLPTLTGWAIDIGAHIGTVAVALALDHPDLRIVAVEALPENVEVLRENVRRNGLEDRVFVEQAAAAAEYETEPVDIVYGWTSSLNQPDHYMHDSRYIGGMVGANETSRTVACTPLSLGTIADRYGIHDIALLKIDCEGCEWFVLQSPLVARCALIWGEMHVGRHGDAARLRALLEPTHKVTMDDSLVVALFRAVRR